MYLRVSEVFCPKYGKILRDKPNLVLHQNPHKEKDTKSCLHHERRYRSQPHLTLHCGEVVDQRHREYSEGKNLLQDYSNFLFFSLKIL